MKKGWLTMIIGRNQRFQRDDTSLQIKDYRNIDLFNIGINVMLEKVPSTLPTPEAKSCRHAFAHFPKNCAKIREITASSFPLAHGRHQP